MKKPVVKLEFEALLVTALALVTVMTFGALFYATINPQIVA
jgi:hypothetical protein